MRVGTYFGRLFLVAQRGLIFERKLRWPDPDAFFGASRESERQQRFNTPWYCMLRRCQAFDCGLLDAT
jgi:hypothetical protein